MSSPSGAIAEVLRRAQQAVDDAEIADDLRAAAFTAAVGLVTGAGAAGSSSGEGAQREADETDESGSPLTRLARKVGIELDALSYLYEEEGNDLRLVIRRDMLPSPNSRAAAMRDVAQLVMVGRQDADLADWTPYDRLRAECAELGVLDPPNFASEIQSLDIRLQGGRRSREARLTRHGLDQAEALLRRITQGVRSSQASG